MKFINACPGCGSEPLREWLAIVAPFLAELALERDPPLCRVLECGRCGLRFSDLRLEEGEVARLYDDYRGERYFQCRHRHEPWYSRRMNEGLGGSPREIQGRQQQLETLLREAGDWSKIQTVLDYGGDRGQFIPSRLAARKWVYEISGVEPLDGIERLASSVQLDGLTFDLVMVCHVFEHVMDPRAFLEEVARYLTPSGTLYIEVPLERPCLSCVQPWLTRSWYGWLNRHSLCLRGVDFLSTAARTVFGWLPPLGLLKASEHVNFYDAHSLEVLLASEGFTVRILSETKTRWRIGRLGVVRCLAARYTGDGGNQR